jgi:hypothetical protein
LVFLDDILTIPESKATELPVSGIGVKKRNAMSEQAGRLTHGLQ